MSVGVPLRYIMVLRRRRAGVCRVSITVPFAVCTRPFFTWSSTCECSTSTPPTYWRYSMRVMPSLSVRSPTFRHSVSYGSANHWLKHSTARLAFWFSSYSDLKKWPLRNSACTESCTSRANQKGRNLHVDFKNALLMRWWLLKLQRFSVYFMMMPVKMRPELMPNRRAEK